MATRLIKRSKHGSNQIGPQVIERIDLDEDFSDVSGDPNSEFALVAPDNTPIGPEGDATYCYLWVKNDGDGTTGIPAFVAAIPPYEVVKYDPKETPVPRGMGPLLTEGENVVARDMVLMRCSRALKEKRRRYEAAQHIKRFGHVDRAREGDVVMSADNPGMAARERTRLGTRTYRGDDAGA